jgi:hypothetical protein
LESIESNQGKRKSKVKLIRSATPLKGTPPHSHSIVPGGLLVMS